MQTRPPTAPCETPGRTPLKTPEQMGLGRVLGHDVMEVVLGVVPKDDVGLEGRDDGVLRQHDEVCAVAGVPLDAIGEDLEAVELGSARGRDDGGVPEAFRGGVLGGARGVDESLVGHVEALGVEHELALR